MLGNIILININSGILGKNQVLLTLINVFNLSQLLKCVHSPSLKL